MAKHGHIHTRFNAHSKGTLSPIHKGYAALCQSIDRARPYTSVVSGDRYPCACGSWSRLPIGLLNHGGNVTTRAFMWVVSMAVTGDKDIVLAGQIWA